MTGAWARDAEAVDLALYAAVAATDTPALDGAMRRLSAVADHAKLWWGAAALLAAGRGARGRRAAASGVTALAATSAVVNLGLKPVLRRPRPDRAAHAVPAVRHVPMPLSRSLPSGHAASAFAFATGVGQVLPQDAAALRGLAAVVAYSRVHTGVHFPADVLLGALVGTAVAQAVTRPGRGLATARGRLRGTPSG